MSKKLIEFTGGDQYGLGPGEVSDAHGNLLTFTDPRNQTNDFYLTFNGPMDDPALVILAVRDSPASRALTSKQGSL